MKYLLIIPARCGSKGIPNKNIIDLNGKPLISYTIENALRIKSINLVEKVVVSTDCKKIATIAEEYGAEVPFIRPKEISGDFSKSYDFVHHALNHYDRQALKFDSVIILQPTSPFRSFDDIKNSIELFTSKNFDSLISVYKEETINNLILYHKKNELGIALNSNHNKGFRRQEKEEIYVRNGAIYITRVDYLRNNDFLISDIPLLYEMKKSRSINIDSFEDLEIARNLLCR